MSRTLWVSAVSPVPDVRCTLLSASGLRLVVRARCDPSSFRVSMPVPPSEREKSSVETWSVSSPAPPCKESAATALETIVAEAADEARADIHAIQRIIAWSAKAGDFSREVPTGYHRAGASRAIQMRSAFFANDVISKAVWMGDFTLFLLVGFLAQMVDGALGMAYGVISSTTLLAFGVSPAHASAAVHAAEVFTTAASGASHLHHRNVDWKLFWRLAPFGILGGCAGAYLLTGLEADAMKPIVTAYLALVGAWLVVRSFRRIPSKPVAPTIVAPLGATGGFLDAAGGGGWGPIVTTGLLGFGGTPRYVVGTVSISEFLITLSVSVTFVLALVTGRWKDAGELTEHFSAVAGLVVGGLFAAPLAGFMAKTLSEKLLLRLIGILIVLLAGWQTTEQLALI